MNENFRVCRVCLAPEKEKGNVLISLLQGNGKKAEIFEAISGINVSFGKFFEHFKNVFLF